jgi:predicted RNase H-like nuclease
MFSNYILLSGFLMENEDVKVVVVDLVVTCPDSNAGSRHPMFGDAMLLH